MAGAGAHLGFATLPFRALAFAFVHNPYALIGVQTLEAPAAPRSAS